MPAATVHQSQGWEDLELRTACTTSQVPGQPGLVNTYFKKKKKKKKASAILKDDGIVLLRKINSVNQVNEETTPWYPQICHEAELRASI